MHPWARIETCALIDRFELGPKVTRDKRHFSTNQRFCFVLQSSVSISRLSTSSGWSFLSWAWFWKVFGRWEILLCDLPCSGLWFGIVRPWKCWWAFRWSISSFLFDTNTRDHDVGAHFRQHNSLYHPVSSILLSSLTLWRNSFWYELSQKHTTSTLTHMLYPLCWSSKFHVEQVGHSTEHHNSIIRVDVPIVVIYRPQCEMRKMSQYLLGSGEAV